MKDRYILLTGSKNNAGDFLIKHRAKKLLSALRSDREILDWNVWEPFDEEKLSIVNASRALILTGGPALQKNMYPGKYKLHSDLRAIKTPIVSMGIGWSCERGEWRDIHDYTLTPQTHALLRQMQEHGVMSSVRDYHSLHVLLSNGYTNTLMTGCPALYSLPHVAQSSVERGEIRRIGFSLGVSMRHSHSMFVQMQESLLLLRRLFPKAQIETVFHHSLEPQKAQVGTKIRAVQQRFVAWLEREGFGYVDISGSAEALIEYYSEVDLHVGYRVHAHIFMSSISKRSILINEDGRGKALEKVIGGVTFAAYDAISDSKIIKSLSRLSTRIGRHTPNRHLLRDLEDALVYEMEHGIKLAQPRSEIDRHFPIMQRFLAQLP